METLSKALSGIVWAIVFFVCSCIVNALVTIGLGNFLASTDFLSASAIGTVTSLIGIGILICGVVAGFFFGYTRPQKNSRGEANPQSTVRKVVSSVIVIVIIGISGYFLYTISRAYQKYGYYVHVSNMSVFVSPLEPGNAQIIDHGRILKTEIARLDKTIDGGDGQHSGLVRWYTCYGIDCDEGWENHPY